MVASHVGANVLLAGVYGVFAAFHCALARETGHWLPVAPIVVQESLLVVLFLTRRRPATVTRRPADWVVAVLATMLPLLLRANREPGSLAAIGLALQLLGGCVAIAALGALGRSVGLVAADRGVRTRGPYGVVRHPAYAAYLASYVGFALAHPGAWNVAVVLATTALMVARVFAEERCLGANPRYRAYRRRVPWRFVPLVC